MNKATVTYQTLRKHEDLGIESVYTHFSICVACERIQHFVWRKGDIVKEVTCECGYSQLVGVMPKEVIEEVSHE